MRQASIAMAIVPVLLALAIVGGLLAYGAGRGMDPTDEVFYLVWTRDPNAYGLIYQPFGYLLHPLFGLVRGDLRSYRLVGFAIAAGAGALLGDAIARKRHDRVVFCCYGALAALTIFFPWIITPSYNSAANVGAMLAIAGLLNASGPYPARRIGGSVAGAAGLCLAAFAKPPLFAIGVVAFLIAAAARRRSSIALVSAVALAPVLMALFLAPAAMPGLLRRMTISQHLLALPNTPLSLPFKIARDWRLVPLPLTVSAIAAGLSLAARRHGWARWLGYAAVALALVHVGGITADALEGEIPDFIGLALTLVVAGYAGVLGWRDQNLLATGLLLAAPFAVALGTFNNQWAQLNFSMTFPFVALFALAAADRSAWRRMAAQALAIAGPVAAMLLAAWFPYSLPASIFAQQTAIRHPLTGSPILVDEQTADFVASARGLAPGALLIDLSGTGPGVAAAIGAHAPVLAWLNPATPTWPDVAWARLSPRQRDGAWFVTPIWPLFARSAPARWLVAHHSQYCAQDLAPMQFWGEDRTLRIWRRCRPAGADRAPMAPANAS